VALAFIGDAVPYQERQATLGRVISVASFGGVLSAALGGIVASVLSWRVLFLVYGLIACGVALALLRLPVAVRSGTAGVTGLRAYRAIIETAGRGAFALYGLVFFEGLAATGMSGYLGAFLHERAGLDYALIGGLLTVNGVAGMLVARQAGWLVRRLSERGMLRLGGGLMTAGYLIAGLQPTLVFFPIAALMTGAGFVIAHSTLQACATELAPAMRGTAVALFAFSLFLGGGLGTFLFGQAIQQFGYDTALHVTAALLGIFALVSGPLLRVVQHRRVAEPQNR
jgi:predicted MFS family arabinose efflux permease